MRRLVPNSYLMPGFDPSEISNGLEAQFRGNGGSIEQAGLYINPSSAARWCMVANQADYLKGQEGAPYQEIADHITQYHLKNIGLLDIFALGPGDGRNETLLTKHLLKHLYPIDLFLVDVSQPLLKVAYECAASTLGASCKKHIFPVLGNMNHLAQGAYFELYTPQLPDSRRLITMFGYTFGNLDQGPFIYEPSFIKECLAGFANGDLLLLDLTLSYAPADQPDVVKKQDPRLSGRHSFGWNAAYEEFLSDTIYHYCRGAVEIKFFEELDSSLCSIPGSYAVAMRAKVHFYDGREKTFTIMQFRRYDMNKLASAIEKLGWSGSAGWPYGNNRMLYLFEKVR